MAKIINLKVIHNILVGNRIILIPILARYLDNKLRNYILNFVGVC